MTRRRWIADEYHQDRAALTGPHAQHLLNSLRVRVGQEFDVVAGESVRRGRVISLGKARVEFELGEAVPHIWIPEITLLLSIFKFDRMEWAIEKCTELGVARIVPLIARRTDAHLASGASKRSERWERLAQQAAEQSRRVSPPKIGVPVELNDAVNIPGSVRILLAENERELTLTGALEEAPAKPNVCLAVGPEGGWTAHEVQAFELAGWRPVTLGATILRAETAAIAAVVVALSALS
jgi:16S rRNA (uracil1498-N3)-methyltransferase